MILGVSGRIGHGKDAIAERLAERWGFVIVRFSAALKEELLERLPRTLAQIHAQQNNGCVDPSHVRRDVCALKPPIIRELLQEYGTEVRRAEDPDYWVKRWIAQAREHPRVVAPDVRFPNEAAAVRAAGGQLWRVVRPQAMTETAVALHVSETAVDGVMWNAIIANNRDLAHLHAVVDAMVAVADRLPA